MGSPPLIGRSEPSSDSSPRMARLPNFSVRTCSWAAKMPRAMGRSNAEPSFLMSAGARLTVIFFSGKV